MQNLQNHALLFCELQEAVCQACLT